MIAFLIVSCDKYSDLWDPFFKTFFKYWDDCPYKIYLASNYKKYNHERVNNISFGDDNDYSTNLINILNLFEEEKLILWFEDALLTKKVDSDIIENIINQVLNCNLDHLKLSMDFPLYYGSKKELFGPIQKGVKYRSAIGMAYYKKEVLRKILKPGESAWELDKSPRPDELNINFYSLNSNLRSKKPLNFINSVIKGKWIYNAPAFFEKEGLSNVLKNREVQGLKDYIYILLYLSYMEILFILKKYRY